MKRALYRDQSGLASIVIAILIVIILSSIVFGFSQLISREQRQSLDKQLSSQAFYAAESAINDASKAIAEQNFLDDKTQCAPYAAGAGQPPALSGNSNNLTGDGNVSYTCLLIDQKPSTIEYKSIRTDHATAFPVAADNGAAVNNITFSWRDVDKGYANFRPAGSRDFTRDANWNATGVLRADIISVDSLGRTVFETNNRAYFLYPNAGGDGVTPNVQPYSLASGEIINGSCGGTGDAARCNVTISGLPGVKSYVRLISMYRPTTVIITASNNVTGQIRDLKDAQIDVDATGRAADITRRIQVRIPRQSTDIPDYTLTSMDTLCKRFLIRPDRIYNDTGPAQCDINQ